MKKHKEVQDNGLFWEMIKMEIRTFTVKFSKRKAKQKRDDETTLLSQLMVLLQEDFSDSVKNEMDKVKTKLAKIVASRSPRTQGAIVRSRSRWYKQGERNSKYFYDLEKTNQRKKHFAFLIKDDGVKINDPKQILEEEEKVFKNIYSSKSMDPNNPEFSEFFEAENVLTEEVTNTCEGLISINRELTNRRLFSARRRRWVTS